MNQRTELCCSPANDLSAVGMITWSIIISVQRRKWSARSSEDRARACKTLAALPVILIRDNVRR